MPLHTWRITQPLANAFRKNVSGSPDGRPEWVNQMAIGDDEGFFGPDSAVWQVHGSLSTLVGGIRALLLQAAHPAPLRGVVEHSRYETDPMGRLAGTTRWLTITTFASREIVMREAKRVNAMHSAVRGGYIDKNKGQRTYSASEDRYLLWVHCAFTDSFIKSYLAMKGGDTNFADRYIKEWAQSAIPLGLKSAPLSLAELESTLDGFRRNELKADEATRDVVRFILNPPFGGLGTLFYRVIANAAIATLDDRDRELLGLPRRSGFWIALSSRLLAIFHAILGAEPPSATVARERIERAKLGRLTNGT